LPLGDADRLNGARTLTRRMREWQVGQRPIGEGVNVIRSPHSHLWDDISVALASIPAIDKDQIATIYT